MLRRIEMSAGTGQIGGAEVAFLVNVESVGAVGLQAGDVRRHVHLVAGGGGEGNSAGDVVVGWLRGGGF
jgi:hypothetical protein